MKGFLIGFIVFLVYASLCVFFFSYVHVDYRVIDTYKDDPGAAERNSQVLNELILNDSMLQEMNSDQDLNTIVKPDSTLNDDSLEIAADSQDVITNDINTPPSAFNIKLPDGSQLITCQGYSKVFQNQSQVKIPYSCREYGIFIKSYLESNVNSTLRIIGFSDVTESPTLGTDRAEYLKKLLTNTGIAASRIITTSAQRNLTFTSGAADGGIEMSIIGSINNTSTDSSLEKSPVKENDAVVTKAAIASKKFTTGFQENNFYGDQNFTSYINTIKKLLSQNPTSKVYAYSYTDREGDAENNFAVSRDNASTVRKILIQGGISSTRIQSVARGEQASGTAGTNRCIIIVIK